MFQVRSNVTCFKLCVEQQIQYLSSWRLYLCDRFFISQAFWNPEAISAHCLVMLWMQFGSGWRILRVGKFLCF